MAGKKQIYIAIIGDLVGSRSLQPDERKAVQEQFNAVLGKVNARFKDEIAALFLITAGDETQGLLHRSHCVYEILRQIQIDLAPIEIVFGVGLGKLSTDIGDYAIGADGPAFHFARAALSQAKSERKEYGKSILREVKFQSDDSVRDTVLNSLFLALAVLKDHWTDKQSRILNLLEFGNNHKDVAEFLDIPLSNISRTIEAARFREYEQVAGSLQIIFSNGLHEALAVKLSKK